MKYRVISLLLVLVLAAGMTVLPVRAAEQWQYEEIEGGVRLTGYLGTETVLTLPDTLDGQRVLEIGPGCFQESGVTEVTIPHGSRIIGEEAFQGCADLKKVHLGGSVNVIGERAFANSGLIKMDIPGCVRTVGAEVFLECNGLYNVIFESGFEEDSIGIGVGFGSGSVQMEEGVACIGDRAFYGCVNLTRMRLPASVTAIGTQAIGYTAGGRQGGYQITGYPGSAAENYANEHEFTFKGLDPQPGTGGKCGAAVQWAWEPASGTLTLSGYGRMYDYAGAENLPWYSFREQIHTVLISEAITSVGDHAFSGSAVSTVELPCTLAWVGQEAFADCADLKELTFVGNAPVFAANAFRGTTLNAWYYHLNPTWTEAVRQNYGGSITWRRMDGLPFVDVPQGSFFYEPVAWALDKGITAGTDATHFGPDNPCQRAAVVTFLWRACGSPEPERDSNPFLDVKQTDFYYKAVLWAVEKGITQGLDATHFGPFVFCNRAQVVTFLYRAMNSPEMTGNDNPFEDVPADQWFTVPVMWAVQEGITSGLDATHFGPESICNRAQIVTFLYRTMSD